MITNSESRKFIISIAFIAGFISSTGTILAFGENGDPRLFPKDSSPYGVPYGQWLNRWWTWNQNMTKSEHPRENPGNCAIHQEGPVWFLIDILTVERVKQGPLSTGPLIPRTCTIPAGKAILVPLLTGEYHNDASVQQPLGKDAMRAAAMKGDEHGTIIAKLDGADLPNLQQYRTQSFSTITIAKNNVFDNLPGTYPSYVDGYFVFLRPLTPGKHVLYLYTKTKNLGPDAQFNYTGEGEYILNIVK